MLQRRIARGVDDVAARRPDEIRLRRRLARRPVARAEGRVVAGRPRPDGGVRRRKDDAPSRAVLRRLGALDLATLDDARRGPVAPCLGLYEATPRVLAHGGAPAGGLAELLEPDLRGGGGAKRAHALISIEFDRELALAAPDDVAGHQRDSRRSALPR